MSNQNGFSIAYKPNYTLEETIKKLPTTDELNSISEVPGSAIPNHSPIFRNSKTLGKPLLHQIHPEYSTTLDFFQNSLSLYPNRPLWAYYPPNEDSYKFITYKDANQLINQLGSGILTILRKNFHDLYRPINNFIISIYSYNRYEWTLTDFAAQFNSITTTSLYDTLGPDSIKYILNMTQSPILFTVESKVESLLILINQNREELSSLKIIVSFDKLSHHTHAHLFNLAKSLGLLLYDFQDVLEIGKLSPQPPIKPTPEFLSTISFTSGTSSLPKGVKITQAQLVTGISQLININSLFFNSLPKGESLRLFVFLPLAHIMERTLSVTVVAPGGCAYFPKHGEDVKTFFNDIKVVKPHTFVTVPRVLTKIESGVKTKFNTDNSLKVRLLRNAVDYKLNYYNKVGNTEKNPYHPFYDLILKGFSKQIGLHELHQFAFGSAPLSPATGLFLKALFNRNRINQGYGLTETCGGCTFSRGNSLVDDNVGAIGSTLEFRLKDHEDLGYSYSKNRSGELLLRGPMLFSGYFKDPIKTAESYDEEGFFLTGDIVSIKDDGSIKIVDRCKNFFKTSQAEFISPEKIENEYLGKLGGDWINQIWVYGEGTQSFLVGIIGIEFEALQKYLTLNFDSEKLEQENLVQFINTLEFKQRFFNDVLNVHKYKLLGYEKIKNFYLDYNTPLNPENDTMTPTLKVKRHNAKKVFKKVIDDLYSEGPLGTRYSGSKL
ncbi:hypothetical protein WICMUC_000608 [Wickerhamomyces mucosus]|uniref:AMP-dependent synthetase/ligase domain-containing protein n=1 Tax=Wickerhamomyces mucosus TaxID=1378264 RepID=A0A9P8TIH3_9ASCO|nr:hypothetical protein WICMUC_000608 [Wickerhamomyces mucosus]